MKTIRYMRPIPDEGPFFVISNGCRLLEYVVEPEEENIENPGLWIKCRSDRMECFVPDEYEDVNEQRIAAYCIFKKDYLNALQGQSKYFKLFAFELRKDDYNVVAFHFTQKTGVFDDVRPLNFTVSTGAKCLEDVELLLDKVGWLPFKLFVPTKDNSTPDVYSVCITFETNGSCVDLVERHLGEVVSIIAYEIRNPGQLEIIEID